MRYTFVSNIMKTDIDGVMVGSDCVGSEGGK